MLSALNDMGLASKSSGRSPWELVVETGPQLGLVYTVPDEGAMLGSGEGCSLRVTDTSVAFRHASIEQRPDGSVWLRNLGGAGSTLVNGDPVGEAPLFEGARLQLGRVQIAVRRSGSTPSPGHDTVPPSRQPIPLTQVDEELRPGDVISERYQLLSKIGEGGMGTVFLAEHLALRKQFAVKVLRSAMSANAGFVKRFEREAISASQIRHRNIVDVMDFGRTPEGRLYFVMEYLAGDTLAKVLSNEGALPAVRALAIAAQICRALIAAHERGILHRDIKPENVVLLNTDEQRDLVKVVDFGIARIEDSFKSVEQTAVGTIIGTPQYMSPEQAAGLEHDARSDIYSAGVLMFEMLSGAPPFVGISPTHVLASHIMKPAPDLPEATRAGPIPPMLRALVKQMLLKPPSDRPQTMFEVALVVDQCLVELGQTPAATPTGLVPPRPKTWPPTPVASVNGTTAARARIARRSKTAKVALGIGGALVTLAVAGGAYEFSRPPRPALPVPVAEVESHPAPALPPKAEVPSTPQQVAVTPPAPTPEPPPPAPTAPSPARITLKLMTKPAGASVFADDHPVGSTPMDLDWAAGQKVRLRFVSAGFHPRSEVLEPQTNQSVTVKLVRRAGKSKSGSGAEPKEGADGVDDLKDSPY